MKLAVKQLGDDDELRELELCGEARGPGLLLSIPLASKTVRLLVTWTTLREAIPEALQEFGPKMIGATRGK